MNKILLGSLALFTVCRCNAAEQSIEDFINYINEEKARGTTNIATKATAYIKNTNGALSLKKINASKEEIEQRTGLKIKESSYTDAKNVKKTTVKFTWKNISDGNSVFLNEKNNNTEENNRNDNFANPLEKIGQKPYVSSKEILNIETKIGGLEDKILEVTRDNNKKIEAILKKLDHIEKSTNNCYCKYEKPNLGTDSSEKTTEKTKDVRPEVNAEQWPDSKIHDVLVKKYPITFGELDRKLDFENDIRGKSLEEVRKISYLTEKCSDVFGGYKPIYNLQLPDDHVLEPYLDKNYKDLLTPDVKNHLREQSKFKKVALSDEPVEKSYEIRNFLGHMESAKNEKYRRYIEISKMKKN